MGGKNSKVHVSLEEHKDQRKNSASGSSLRSFSENSVNSRCAEKKSHGGLSQTDINSMNIRDTAKNHEAPNKKPGYQTIDFDLDPERFNSTHSTVSKSSVKKRPSSVRGSFSLRVGSTLRELL